MKFLEDLRSLDRNNIGGWPQSIKIFFTVLLFALIGFVGWYTYISDQQDQLQQLYARIRVRLAVALQPLLNQAGLHLRRRERQYERLTGCGGRVRGG